MNQDNNLNEQNVQNNNQTPQVGQVATNISNPSNVQSVSTELPKTEVQNVSVPSDTTNNVPKKEGSAKYVFAFLFFIGIIAFVFFLPEISELVKVRMNQTSENNKTDLLNDGVLVCKISRVTDQTDTNYEFSFKFNDKELITSSLLTKYESLDTTFLEERKAQCDLMSSVAENTDGISVDCNYSNGILKVTEDYIHKDINSSSLTAYTEAGGTYPEFEYGKNIYDIQTKLLHDGYDCDVKVDNE